MAPVPATSGSNRTACLLCGAPIAGGGEGAFCCAGCARVHAVLKGIDPVAGEEYVRAARALGIIPGGRATVPPDPPPPDPSAEREERFRVDGIVCPSCTWIIERVLASQNGVRAARFDFFSGTGTVRYDLRHSSAFALAAVLEPLGYRLSAAADEAPERLSRGVTFAFIACAVITMNLMSLSVIRYARDAGWIDAVPAFLPWIELLLCLPVIWLGLGPVARRAWEGARRHTVTMDALVAISAGSAFVLSCAAMAAGRRDIYFETAAGLVTISMLSRMIEARLRGHALRETAALMRLEVVRVRIPEPDGGERYSLVKDVAPGTVVRFMQGETVAFDGEVVADAGGVLVSEAFLTGEPTPVHKVAGDPVAAGSVVVESPLDLMVVRPYDRTRLYLIAESLRATLQESESRLRSADAVAGWFAPGVLVLAVLVWLARAAAHGWGCALAPGGWFPSVAVLAVACPCAFSLAGVAAITAGTGSLFRRGFLVKSAAQFEDLHRAGTVIFDKTGTLTGGRLSVEGLFWRESEKLELPGLVLEAERHASHPAAHALREYLVSKGVVAPGLDGAAVEDLPGQGRRLRVGDADFAVGSAGIFRDTFTPAGTTAAHTLIWVGEGGVAAGCFVLTDAVRPDARETVSRLKAAGLRVEILSGDRQEVCDRVAAEVGADGARGGATLEEKVALIKGRAAAGEQIVYVGDGTNDALAMREAAASVAIGGSTDEALTAAGFVMLHARLGALADLVDAGRRLWRVIRGNYLWAFGFNGLFVPFAAAGYLTPLAAMLLMLASSSAVLLNSLRLRE